MTKYTITRRLVESVMKTEPINSADFNTMENDILYKDKRKKSITYNDFFFKCIEWAWKKETKYLLVSSYRNCQIHKEHEKNKFELIKSFDNIDQKQALFDACQFILDNSN